MPEATTAARRTNPVAPSRGFGDDGTVARALVIDLDGVVRRWDPLTDIEARLGLPAGAILSVAFEPDRLAAAITGRASDEHWRRGVAVELSERFGVDGAAAVAAWAAPCGVVDVDVLEEVRRARRSVPVALLSNATSRLGADLERLGLSDAFDVVLNSAELGVAKPDPAVFAAVLARLDVTAGDCLFVDDSVRNVEAARAAGLVAHHHRDLDGLVDFLDAQLSGR